MSRCKASYGLDAPAVVKLCFVLAIVFLCVAITAQMYLTLWWLKLVIVLPVLVIGVCLLWPVVTIIQGSYVKKFKVRDALLKQIDWSHVRHMLDVGCGRGLLLIGAAKRMITGVAMGIDIWATIDQTGNKPEATLYNAQCEKVRDKIELITGDMRSMPFVDGQFDAVISSWALHNVKGKEEREKALKEIVRVLKPGGQLAIVDIQYAHEYYEFFQKAGFTVTITGPQYTFGIPEYMIIGKKL